MYIIYHYKRPRPASTSEGILFFCLTIAAVRSVVLGPIFLYRTFLVFLNGSFRVAQKVLWSEEEEEEEEEEPERSEENGVFCQADGESFEQRCPSIHPSKKKKLHSSCRQPNHLRSLPLAGYYTVISYHSRTRGRFVGNASQVVGNAILRQVERTFEGKKEETYFLDFFIRLHFRPSFRTRLASCRLSIRRPTNHLRRRRSAATSPSSLYQYSTEATL